MALQAIGQLKMFIQQPASMQHVHFFIIPPTGMSTDSQQVLDNHHNTYSTADSKGIQMINRKLGKMLNIDNTISDYDLITCTMIPGSVFPRSQDVMLPC
jgi:hypothetical protein